MEERLCSLLLRAAQTSKEMYYARIIIGAIANRFPSQGDAVSQFLNDILWGEIVQ
jgi:hypothetical protein